MTTILFMGLHYMVSLFSSSDTIKIPAILSKEFNFRVCSVSPLSKSDLKADSLVQAFHGRILFKTLFLDKRAYADSTNSVFNQLAYTVFIGCRNDSIYVGIDRNHNNLFEYNEIKEMQAYHKIVFSYDIYPSEYCNDCHFVDSTILHLIPFVNQVHYNDASATDTMLQLSYSRGYVKKYKINDTLELTSSSLSIERSDSSFPYKYIGYSPSGIFAIYPDRDFLTLGNNNYSIIKNLNKDTLYLVLTKNSFLKVKIQAVPASFLNGLDPLELKENKKANIIFKKKYVLLDFWATYCAPCINAMPQLNELHKRFNSKIQLVSICIDTKDNIKKAKRLVKNNLNYEQYFVSERSKLDQSLLVNAGIVAYPTYILLDNNGNVLSLVNDISIIDLIIKNVFNGIKSF